MGAISTFHSACGERSRVGLGLAEEDKENTSIRAFVQKSAALAFVPLHFVCVAWDGLKADIPDEGRVKSYSEYFDETRMSGQFKPCLWNYYAHVGPRTNNHLEDWHKRLKE